MAMTHPHTSNQRGNNAEAGNVTFQIGDKVREGAHVGTVTDVGTVLVQVKTDEGISRVVCPWELVPIVFVSDGFGAYLAPE
jgi:hypothetical protein